MKIIKKTKQDDVWEHWFKAEKPDAHKELNGFKLLTEINCWRCDIKWCLPKDIKWFETEIEEDDIKKLYIISSTDWTDVSGEAFTVKKVFENLDRHSIDSDTVRIVNNIKDKIAFLKSGGILDTYLIMVADNLSGPFTIIEGNKRAVAFLKHNSLIGIKIYLGISNDIRSYQWARDMYVIKSKN